MAGSGSRDAWATDSEWESELEHEDAAASAWLDALPDYDDEDVPDLMDSSSDEDQGPPEGYDRLHFKGYKHAPPLKRVTGKPSPYPHHELKLAKQVVRRSSDIKAETLGLPGIFFRRMVALAVPAWLFTVIWHLRRMASLATEESVEAVEFYAGRRTIQRASVSGGRMRWPSTRLIQKARMSAPTSDSCTL